MIKTRPIFVTLVCLYLLINGCSLLFFSFGNLKDPDIQAAMMAVSLPYALQVAVIYINSITLIAAGMFMWQEANWARWLYLGWGFINIDYGIYIQANWHNNVLPIGVYLTTALILLLPSANKYFSSVIDYTDDFND